MNVHIVQADHWNIAGRPMTAHATRPLAEAEALNLVNRLRRDAGLPQEKTSWEAGLVSLKDKVAKLGFDRDEVDVWITELEVESSAGA